MSKNSKTNKGTSSTSFSTADGRVPGQPAVTGGRDLVADGKSAADPTTGGRDFTVEPVLVSAAEEDTIASQSVAEGGKYIRDAFKPEASGTGSVGNAHRPFKLR